MLDNVNNRDSISRKPRLSRFGTSRNNIFFVTILIVTAFVTAVRILHNNAYFMSSSSGTAIKTSDNLQASSSGVISIPQDEVAVVNEEKKENAFAGSITSNSSIAAEEEEEVHVAPSITPADDKLGLQNTTEQEENGVDHVPTAGSWTTINVTDLPSLLHGKTNVALNKPAKETGEIGTMHDAFKAVDGSINSFTATSNECTSLWQVHLGGMHEVDSIIIYNRLGCCPERLSNFTLELLVPKDGFWVTNAYVEVENEMGAVGVFIFPEGARSRGSIVRVQLKGCGFLSLAEVEVYGTPVAVSKDDSNQNDAAGETNGNVNAMSGNHSKEQENDRYCAINGNNTQVRDSACSSMLSPQLKSKPAWHFFGDSQMGFLFEALQIYYPRDISLVRRACCNRCGFLDYCGLDRASVWTPPNASLTQGPVKYGLRNHFCSDLAGWLNTMVKSTGDHFMEYMVVEYASDVEHQTPHTNTTQETAVLYLQNQNVSIRDTVCVANNGIHDQNACWNRDKCLYLENIKTYFQLLDSVCGSIVWIGLTSVGGDMRRPQRDERALEWNRAIAKLLATSYPQKAYFVDVWNLSLTSKRRDNIHFQYDYYKTLSALFANLM